MTGSDSADDSADNLKLVNVRAVQFSELDNYIASSNLQL